MFLLDIESIQRGLDERFLPLEPMLTGLRLAKSRPLAARKTAADCASSLNVKLPNDFAEITRRFEFGRLTIGPIKFCYTGDYLDWKIETNRDDPEVRFSWWGGERRPEELLMIAGSDLFTFFLDTANESVSASENGELVQGQGLLVATDFDRFVRGVGTVMLERNPHGENEGLADSIGEAVGAVRGSRFWRWLAE